MNGKAKADASDLIENDSILILFQGLGLQWRVTGISPPCSNAIRNGCGFCGVSSGYNDGFNFCLYYYFRLRDSGLNVMFIYLIKKKNIGISDSTW